MNLCRQISSRHSPGSSRTTVITQRRIRNTYCSNCFPSGSSTLATDKRTCGFSSTSRSPWIVHRVRAGEGVSLVTNGRYPAPDARRASPHRDPRSDLASISSRAARRGRLTGRARPTDAPYDPLPTVSAMPPPNRAFACRVSVTVGDLLGMRASAAAVHWSADV
jgi:hypothetical protein